MRDLLALTGHTLHAVVVLGGLAGMAAILAPGVAQRAGLLRAPDGPVERRVAELRERVATGTLARVARADETVGTPPAVPGPRRTPGGAPHPPASVGSVAGDPLLAAAVVAGVAAAGVHAAVGPMHLGAYPVLAAGFLVVAALQAGWALAVLAPAASAPGASPAAAATRLALLGAVLHGGALVAWAASRTVGLPFGLHGAGPQPVGAWDLAAVAWQLVALSWCLGLLAGRRPATARPAWGTRGVRVFLGASALVLGVLTISGASA